MVCRMRDLWSWQQGGMKWYIKCMSLLKAISFNCSSIPGIIKAYIINLFTYWCPRRINCLVWESLTFLHQESNKYYKTYIVSVLGREEGSVMSETSFYYQDRDRDFLKPSLDIETGIETFENLVLILRLVSRLLELQSWYRDWYRDF